jgi:hypothetical protein
VRAPGGQACSALISGPGPPDRATRQVTATPRDLTQRLRRSVTAAELDAVQRLAPAGSAAWPSRDTIVIAAVHYSRRMSESTSVIGRWRITEMDNWDQEAVNLVQPGFIEFDDDGLGGLGFIVVTGELDCRDADRARAATAWNIVTGDPQAPGPEAERPYTVIFSRQARRNLHENLGMAGWIASLPAQIIGVGGGVLAS